jgi:hypothetical protein
MPMVTGSQAPAYAVTPNADGSISVLIHELRDPDRLEADLAGLGVHVDISYHTSDLACPGGRFAPSQQLTAEQQESSPTDGSSARTRRPRAMSHSGSTRSASRQARPQPCGLTLTPRIPT